jgi:hypothetical protein
MHAHKQEKRMGCMYQTITHNTPVASHNAHHKSATSPHLASHMQQSLSSAQLSLLPIPFQSSDTHPRIPIPVNPAIQACPSSPSSRKDSHRFSLTGTPSAYSRCCIYRPQQSRAVIQSWITRTGPCLLLSIGAIAILTFSSQLLFE